MCIQIKNTNDLKYVGSSIKKELNAIKDRELEDGFKKEVNRYSSKSKLNKLLKYLKEIINCNSIPS